MAARTGTRGEDEGVVKYSVRGKSAIVTGAGSGINFSFASLLLSRGCSVLLADLTLRPEARALLTKYSSNTPRAMYCQTDVTDWAQLQRMFDTAIRHFHHIDIVCPGAGIYDPHWSNFWHPPGSPRSLDAPASSRYKTLDVNVTHPIRTTQMAISHFLNPPEGVEAVSPTNPKRVLLVSSIAGQNPNFHTPIYVAGKHAMNGFIRSLAPLEQRVGIRVNGVAPGVVKTPLWTEHAEKLAFFDEERDEWAAPEEVAEGMLRCVEDGELGGGTVLEVGKGQMRLVQALNDPGPRGKGHTVSNLTPMYEEVFGWLGERGWGKSKL